MTQPKPRLLQIARLPLPALDTELAARYDVVCLSDQADPVAFLAEHGASFTGVVTSASIGLKGEVIAALPRLQVISSFGVGFDALDIAAARARGIPVGYTPDVLNDCVADMAFALMLDVSRGVAASDRFVRRGEWPKARYAPLTRVSGKRLGIVGMGRIGQAVARRAKAFGMQVHYHNRKPVSPRIAEELGCTYWESLDQMLARMDFISVNCPHTPATYHLLSARRLKLLRPHAIVVNTARGEVIDEGALANMLARGEIAGAGLDVYEHEPAINPKLLKLPNVVLLPHMGSATVEGRIDMGEKVIVNVKTFMDGHRPPDRVIPAML